MRVQGSDKREHINSNIGVLLGPERIMCHLRKNGREEGWGGGGLRFLHNPLRFPTLSKEPSLGSDPWSISTNVVYTGYLCSQAWEGSSEGLEAGRLATGPTGALQRRRISVWAFRWPGTYCKSRGELYVVESENWPHRGGRLMGSSLPGQHGPESDLRTCPSQDLW